VDVPWNSVDGVKDGPGPSLMSESKPRLKTKIKEPILTVVIITENRVPIVREIRLRIDTKMMAMTAVSCSISTCKSRTEK
jgi:hypothetical protein